MGASHSGYVDQDDELPQSSVLSITCFATAINQIIKNWGLGAQRLVHGWLQCTLYMDDYSISSFQHEIKHFWHTNSNYNQYTEEVDKKKGMRFAKKKKKKKKK